MGTSAVIREFIITRCLFGAEPSFDDDTSFLESGILDFLQFQQLIDFLEDAYGIAIDFEEMIPENLDSVSKLANFVSRKTSSSPIRPSLLPA